MGTTGTHEQYKREEKYCFFHFNSLIELFTDSLPYPSCPRASVGHPFSLRLDSRLRGNDDKNVQIIMRCLIRFIS
jgi:hypothetical protein